MPFQAVIDLVVAEGLWPPGPNLEQPAARILRHLAADHRAAILERLEPVGMRLAERLFDLLGRPRVREALDAVRVRVLRRGEASLRES